MAHGIMSTQMSGVEIATLRLNAEKLKVEMQWRAIPQIKIDRFIGLTKSIRKVPIKIILGISDYETENFRIDLTNMFCQAGFTNLEIIRKEGVSIVGAPLGSEEFYQNPIEAFVLYRRDNGAAEIQFSVNPKKTNQIENVFYYTDPNGVVETLLDSLNKIGVPVLLKDSSGMLNPEEIGIFIPEKLH